MQPQDLLIVLLLMIEKNPLMQKDIAYRLGLSPAAVSYAMTRLEEINLISDNRQMVMRRKVLDFIRYAIDIVYPAKLGPQVRGIPTARSFHLFDEKINFEESINHQMNSINSYVWQEGNGTAIGSAIKPIYPSIPKIVSSEAELYKTLNLIDIMRVGNSREQKLAMEALEHQLIG